MCTVIWARRDGGYRLIFNRDELRTRRPAEPPRRRRVGERQVLAPIDGDRGGTWLAVNDCGWTVCLLNREVAPPAGGWGRRESRGWIVDGLADVRAFAGAAERLAAIEAQSFRPFTLLCVAADGSARVATSDGRGLSPLASPPQPLLASSSFDEPAARAARQRLFLERLSKAAGGAEADAAMTAFQRSHRPARGPLSPCMHRLDARTVSQCEVVIDGPRIALAYAAGPPCRTPLGEPVLLPRERCSTVFSG
ncbi:MAG: NRDE family protein [Acidobacteriota bacterium]